MDIFTVDELKQHLNIYQTKLSIYDVKKRLNVYKKTHVDNSSVLFIMFILSFTNIFYKPKNHFF